MATQGQAKMSRNHIPSFLVIAVCILLPDQHRTLHTHQRHFSLSLLSVAQTEKFWSRLFFPRMTRLKRSKRRSRWQRNLRIRNEWAVIARIMRGIIARDGQIMLMLGSNLSPNTEFATKNSFRLREFRPLTHIGRGGRVHATLKSCTGWVSPNLTFQLTTSMQPQYTTESETDAATTGTPNTVCCCWLRGMIWPDWRDVAISVSFWEFPSRVNRWRNFSPGCVQVITYFRK